MSQHALDGHVTRREFGFCLAAICNGFEKPKPYILLTLMKELEPLSNKSATNEEDQPFRAAFLNSRDNDRSEMSKSLKKVVADMASTLIDDRNTYLHSAGILVLPLMANPGSCTQPMMKEDNTPEGYYFQCERMVHHHSA